MARTCNGNLVIYPHVWSANLRYFCMYLLGELTTEFV